jgi:glucan endo-1,3-beta-D-glucosidase
MLCGSSILGALAALSFTGLVAAEAASQAIIGFNCAANTTDNKFKQLNDFKKEFTAAKALAGTDGKFTSTRLYTMIQGDKLDGYISAIDAAIETKTSMLLGMWTSAGAEMVDKEIGALLKAIEARGTAFTDLVVGISVGSEDVYRTTTLGVDSGAGPGCSPQELIKYIDQVRTALSATPLAEVKIGHVDTYNVWSDHSQDATAAMPDLINKVDFIGVNAFPYWEKTKDNPIEKAKELFWKDYEDVKAKTGTKAIWITETGWPSSELQQLHFSHQTHKLKNACVSRQDTEQSSSQCRQCRQVLESSRM